MSKERELLIEIMSYIAKGKLKVEGLESNEYETIREAKELLAQRKKPNTKFVDPYAMFRRNYPFQE